MIKCLSDLYYRIGGWFTVLMVGFALILLPFALEKLDSPFTFLMCGGFMVVGVAPNYKGDEDKIHFYSALVSVGCSFCWLYIVNPWALITMLVWLFPVKFDSERWLLYWEVALIQAVLTSLV